MRHPLPPCARLAVAGLLALCLCACSSAPTGSPAAGGNDAAKGQAKAPSLDPVVLGPTPGRVRDRTPMPQGGDFDFGGGRRVRARDTEAGEAPASAAVLAEEPAELGPASSRGTQREPTLAGSGDLSAEERRQLTNLAPGAIADHGIRVTWEALAVERDLVANPRLGRKPQQGVLPDSKIVLVSADHPAALGRQKGRASTREADGSQVAVLEPDDMQQFVKGLREAGFFKLSRPTEGVAPLFEDSEARGRVTVEVDGVSRTLLSLRGQGAQGATRDVPRVYSQAKQAVATIRNQTPALSVVTTGGKPARARPRLGADKSRTLTPEEAAAVLGEAPPPPPVDDDWGLGK